MNTMAAVILDNGRTSVHDGVLAVEFPMGVRYLNSTSLPKDQGHVQVVDGQGVLISGISLPRKKHAIFMLSLGVQSNAGDSLIFTVYFHDYEQQCIDTERVEMFLLK